MGRVFELGPFVLDEAAGIMTRDGQVTPLGSQVHLQTAAISFGDA